MERRTKRLFDLYKTPRSNGIFYSMMADADLNALFTSLGLTKDDDYHAMDFDYMYNHSGLKTVSSLIEELLDAIVVDDDGERVFINPYKQVTWDYVINTVDADLIRFVIKSRFLDKWNGLAETIKLKFDPLSPFRMETDETRNEDLTSKDNSSNEYSDSSKNDTNASTTGSDTGSRWGFNSAENVPTEKSASEGSSSGTTEAQSSGNSARSSTYERGTDTVRHNVRQGNIGNRSSQELIEEQRKMLLFQIFDIIYVDLDSVLTRSKYIL